MKKILLVVFLLPFVCKAQDTEHQPWKEFDVDSAKFVAEFGNAFEYRWQERMKRESKSHNLVVLIGAKIYWTNELSTFIQNLGWDVDFADGTGCTKYVFSNTTTHKIVMTAYYDKEYRTRGVTITGPADDLITIFARYWERSDISLNALKSKKVVYQNFISDRASMSWPGTNPVIKIAKNPDAIIDFEKTVKANP